MTRVREETADHGTREGSLIALASTGGVITSAGLVLAATFLVLGSLPLVFLAELGVAVALGVLLDTMIVRSVLVTAINLDLGGKIWWPSKLDRRGRAPTRRRSRSRTKSPRSEVSLRTPSRYPEPFRVGSGNSDDPCPWSCKGDPHAPSDRRQTHRPRHQVDRPRRGHPGSRAASARSPGSPGRPEQRDPSWLPESAESTAALSGPRRSRTRTTSPAWSYYARLNRAGSPPSSRTQAAARPRTPRRSASSRALSGEVQGTELRSSEDGEVNAHCLVTYDLGKDGWILAPGMADTSARSARGDRGLTSTSPGRRPGRRLGAAFEGIDGPLLFATVVVVTLLLLTYRSPVLWLLPLFSAVGAPALTAMATDLPARQGRRHRGQRPERGHPDGAGVRRRHRLRAAAGRPVPGGTAPARGRHEAMAHALHRAAPAIIACAATVIAGLLCLLAADLNSTSGSRPGRRDRHRCARWWRC